jgi:hypothetical protein
VLLLLLAAAGELAGAVLGILLLKSGGLPMSREQPRWTAHAHKQHNTCQQTTASNSLVSWQVQCW